MIVLRQEALQLLSSYVNLPYIKVKMRKISNFVAICQYCINECLNGIQFEIKI